jgi:hypothetical protein
MTISTPVEVTQQFPLKLWSVRSHDIYRLLQDLRQYAGIRSIHGFGQSAHVAFREGLVDKHSLTAHLEKTGHKEISMEEISATIEDCFMELMTPAGKNG